MAPTEALQPCIVLRLQAYGEADEIAVLLHPLRGRVDAIARAARKSRSRFSGLAPFAEVGAMLQSGRGRLPNLREVVALGPGLGDAPSWTALCLASHATDLAAQCAQPEHEDTRLYAWLRHAIAAVREGTAGRARGLRVGIEATLLDALGVLADLQVCARCHRSTAAGAAWPDPEAGLLCSACASIDKVGLPADVVLALALVVDDPRRLHDLAPALGSAAAGVAAHRIAQRVAQVVPGVRKGSELLREAIAADEG
ncbi:MAG: DNA repair protein RecO [Myxococcales bacterium]|nr:DNA repair protein RecO [Myxococcales bacterium]